MKLFLNLLFKIFPQIVLPLRLGEEGLHEHQIRRYTCQANICSTGTSFLKVKISKCFILVQLSYTDKFYS
jgi:hypothetical protein